MKYKIGDRVEDHAGYIGRVNGMTEWKGSVWYHIRFPSGVAVRYEQELRKLTEDAE